MENYGKVFGKLKGLKREGANWSAQCPAHEDARSSLSLLVSHEDGRLLVNCHAGCGFAEIVGALGLRAIDFFQPDQQGGHPMEATTYEYKDEHGTLLFQAVRREPKDFRQRRPDGAGGWVWNLNGAKRVPYRLPELLEAGSERVVFVVEGEKDVETLMGLGLVATCNPGGAGKWRDSFSHYLEGRRVVVVPDNDGPGHKHAEEVAASVAGVATEVRIVELPDLVDKGDVTDWVQAGGTKAQLHELFKATGAWAGPTGHQRPQAAPEGYAAQYKPSPAINGPKGHREAQRLLNGVRKLLARAEALGGDDPWAVVYLVTGIMEELRNGKEIE